MFKPFGSTSPWAEPPWYSGRPSPYYKESHIKLRNYIRQWTEEARFSISSPSTLYPQVSFKDIIDTIQNVAGNSEEWEAAGKVPDDVYEKSAKDGLIVPISGGNRIPKEWAGYPIAAGIKAEEWDGFHDFILWDELFRGAPSLSSVFIGLVVGAPPLKQFASQQLQDKVLPELLTGKKRICLAITEPSAGSDVRNITTVAEKTPDGKHYIVNGEKKMSHFKMPGLRTD